MTDLSYQLYSSRKFPPLTDTLRLLAEIGYTQVEGYGALLADPKTLDELAAGLKATGLTMPTGHFGLEMARDEVARVKQIAQMLGVKAIFAPYLLPDARPTDSAGWTAFGKELARIAAPYWEAGYIFGWHNHDFELVPTAQGDLPLDLILAADERLALELDLAWVVRGGQDPLAVIARHGARVVAAHVKDIAPAGQNVDEDGWADAGHGTLDWTAYGAALRAAGTRWFIVEHDNPSDQKRFAQRSFAAASAL